MPKKKKKKAQRTKIRNDGGLTLNAKIYEGERPILDLRRRNLTSGLNDLNFFSEKKLNVKIKKKTKGDKNRGCRS